MNANLKILNVLIEEMGAEAVLKICQERLQPKTSEPQKPVVKVVGAKKVIPKKADAPAPAPAPASPEISSEKPPSEPPKAPVKVVGPKKVIVKKKEEPVAKNLAAELEEAKKEGSWTCPPCGQGEGGDHRLCVFNTFDCDVEAWEKACGINEAKEEVKEVKEAKKEEKKAAGRPKKAVAEVPRCDARIYGEQVEMEGTKAPNGNPLHAYRPAQCERKGGETLAVPEEGDPRRLADGEEVAEDEGKFHLCKVCIKRWEGRTEHAENWHGFFDDNGAPETSHFVNGSWYKKKMAAVQTKADE